MRIVSSTAISFNSNPVANTDLEIPNRKPEIISVVPKALGMVVKTAPGGSVIQLEAVVRDLDSDLLSFDWRALPGEGALAGAGGQTILWTLPLEAGIHSVYLEVKDGRGGYAIHKIDFQVDRADTLFSGRVVDQRTGLPVEKADVSANSVPTQSDANGFFSVHAPINKRYVLNITKFGYALFSRVVDAGETGQTWRLVPAQLDIVDPRGPLVLVDKRPELGKQERRGATVRVPANALVDAAGNPPPGLLTSSLVTHNIADGEAPGDWGALSGGKEVNLISYGAGFVEFVDPGTGKKYNLGNGAQGEIDMFPKASMLAGAPAQAPMWSYDEADGYWKETGNGKFLTTEMFTGTLKHFSAFNTDIAFADAACLKVLLYPPLPTGVRLRMTVLTGTKFTQTFDFVLDRPLRGIYRVPGNYQVRLQLFDPSGNEYTSNLVIERVPGTPLAGNIVNTGAPIPAGGNLWPDEPYDTCQLVILRLDVATTPSVFLTFKGVGTEPQAQGYYAAVDPSNLRTTLGGWWSANGFTPGANGWPLDSTSGDAAVFRTSYLNNNDLGSGRDMYFRNLGGGRMAAFVSNFGLFDQNPGNADLALARVTPEATVCMEFSPVEGGTTPIVKFFVYAGAGGQASAVRQTGANLDNFGVKFVPNLCLNCHGGDYNPANPASPGTDINMQARFRELDYSTYKFPGARLVPNPAEQAAFRSQNDLIRNAGSASTSQGIRDLINGWYQPTGSSTTIEDNSFVPTLWAGTVGQPVYRDVIKVSCRTCHVAFDDGNQDFKLNFTTYNQLKACNGFLENFLLCDGCRMPHAVVTYRNFWLSGSPHEPGVMRAFFDGADWPAFLNCP